MAAQAPMISSRISAEIFDKYQSHKEEISLREVVEGALKTAIAQVEQAKASGSFWDEQRLTTIITELLRREAANSHVTPWLSPYQIVELLRRHHPSIVAAQDWPLGGRGSGKHYTWAVYVAKTMAQMIEDGKMPLVEYGILSNAFVEAYWYTIDGVSTEASSNASTYPISLFRYRG